MDINKNNWERKLQMQNILVGYGLNIISLVEAEKRMSILLQQTKLVVSEVEL